MLKIIYLALIPVPFFYLIYFRHFFTYYRAQGRTPSYLKHLESFLYGIGLALAIMLAAPLLDRLLRIDSVAAEAFIKAALVEKLGALAVIYIVLRHYPSFNILEAVISGILVGSGFSLVENIFYTISFGPSVIIVRDLFSVPLHLTTCGLIGYYMGASRLSRTAVYRRLYALRAFFMPFVLHGIFDTLLLKGGACAYLIGPLVIIIVGGLEIYIARSKLMPSGEALSGEGLHFEDWLLKYRQPRYERWILNSMGTVDNVREPFFRAHRGALLWMAAFTFFAAGIILFPFAREISSLLGLNIKNEEQVLLASVYPASIGIILALVGSVNPAFFTSSVVKIPIIFDAVICRLCGDEDLVTFDITLSGCFLRTFEPLTIERENTAYFENGGFKSPRIQMELLWENHREHMAGEPTGSIVKFINPGFDFYRFLIKYYLFRISKGIVFNLRLPGFQGIRTLFMRPATVMQKVVVYQPGAHVFSQGEEIKTFYYIKKGTVNFYKEMDSGERIFLESMEAGQIFNEMALLGDRRRSVTAECQTLCVIATAQADNLEALIRSNPDFAIALVRKLAKRADQTQGELTQSINYLQKLLQLNTRRARNAVILLAAELGHGHGDRGLDYRLSPDIERLMSGMGLSQEDILSYINNSLGLKDAAAIQIRPDAAEAIEKILSDARIELIIKK